MVSHWQTQTSVEGIKDPCIVSEWISQFLFCHCTCHMLTGFFQSSQMFLSCVTFWSRIPIVLFLDSRSIWPDPLDYSFSLLCQGKFKRPVTKSFLRISQFRSPLHPDNLNKVKCNTVHLASLRYIKCVVWLSSKHQFSAQVLLSKT